MQERLARRRFFGAAATLALVGSASMRAWLNRAVVASPLPQGDWLALDSTPTDTPAPTATPHIATPAEAAPIFARIWDATDTLARRS